MNNQQAFDKIVKHLKDQKWVQAMGRLSHSASTCSFRGVEGRKCAVGCLIPDNLYKEEMEDACVGHVQSQVPEIKNVNTSMLYDLMFFHDDQMGYADEEGKLLLLKEICTKYKLEWNHE